MTLCRAKLGSELTIVCLEMSNQERRQRIISRHGGESEVTELVDVVERNSEPIAEDEKNVIVIQVKIRADTFLVKNDMFSRVFNH